MNCMKLKYMRSEEVALGETEVGSDEIEEIKEYLYSGLAMYKAKNSS